jgi:uncharacterized protein
MPTIGLDPLQCVAIALAVLIYGFAKGGAGAPLSAVCVPLMSLVLSPFRAAAILLPLLLVLDLLALVSFRGCFDRRQLWLLLPASLVGMGLATLAGQKLSSDDLRVLIGLICLGFVLLRWLRKPTVPELDGPATRQALTARFWGCMAGFTSTLVHAGGPPVMVHLMGLRLEPRLLAGTQAWFFASLNYSKVVPYVFTSQLDLPTLKLSLLFMPLTPIGIVLGQRFLRNTSRELIYFIFSAALLLSGGLLLWQGLAGRLLHV